MGKIRVFSIKVALATMCAGKLMDKLRCKYSIVLNILFGNVQQIYTGFLNTCALEGHLHIRARALKAW